MFSGPHADPAKYSPAKGKTASFPSLNHPVPGQSAPAPDMRFVQPGHERFQHYFSNTYNKHCSFPTQEYHQAEFLLERVHIKGP